MAFSSVVCEILIGVLLLSLPSSLSFPMPMVPDNFAGGDIDGLEEVSQMTVPNLEGRSVVIIPTYNYVYENMGREPIPASNFEDDRPRQVFPEVDVRGFDEDVFDEGFGEWYPMKRF